MEAGNLRVRLSIQLFLIAILLCPIVYGKTIFVDDDATGLNDGTSWENAYVYLQDALADANTADKPVEIQVAQGVYKPNGGLVAIPEFDWRTASFQLINGVSIAGGYAGVGLKDPNARDIKIYETVLSGDLTGDDTTWKWNERQYKLLPEDTREPIGIWLSGPNREDNTYHVVVGSNTDETAVLDGVTVSNGNAVITPYSSNHNGGGGMYCKAGNPIVINCTFSRNAARLGGGIYISESTNINIVNCVIKENKADDSGGGIYCRRSDIVIQDCKVTNNMAANGGGIVFSGNLPLISNCLISSNLADKEPFSLWERRSGGGGITCDQSNPRIINCTIVGNKANAAGGGINYPGGWAEATIENCIIWGNSAQFGNQLARMCCLCVIGCVNIELRYCCIQMGENAVFAEGWDEWETGNKWIIDLEASHSIDSDPCFTNPGYWADAIDPNIAAEPNDPNAVWVDGDYHLKSQAGRWDSVSESWVVDKVTSPCIDAGDPSSPVGDEPEPNGCRINMGAYGGTAEASKSGSAWWFETTQGAIAAEGLVVILPHEHIFTDLRGPGTRGYGEADAADVVRVMAPLLEEAKQNGVGLLFECSSIGVGRNISILSEVSKVSGLPVVVPTGVYGRANFAPVEHKNMSEDELTELFISEIREGIEGSDIKAGFIKIATGGSAMNSLEEKILRAAGRAAQETGAAVASHTTVGSNATRQADILESISPEIRFIWVHAQSANNRDLYRQLAERGVFIEFDSLGWNPGQDSTFIASIKDLLAAGFGDKILLSHDAGWYQPGEKNGGTQMPYTYLIETFIPKFRDSGVDDETIRMITQINPIRAFGFKEF